MAGYRRANPQDLEFICAVHAESMRPHIEKQWGFWDEAAQRERILRSTRPETHWIIEVGADAAGCYWVREHPGELELVRLWLLARWQNGGIGTAVLGELCARADEEGLPFRLRVLKVNPARALYERVGFAVTGETDSHYVMRRPPRVPAQSFRSS